MVRPDRDGERGLGFLTGDGYRLGGAKFSEVLLSHLVQGDTVPWLSSSRATDGEGGSSTGSQVCLENEQAQQKGPGWV